MNFIFFKIFSFGTPYGFYSSFGDQRVMHSFSIFWKFLNGVTLTPIQKEKQPYSMNSLQSFVCFLLQGRLFCNNFGQLGIWHLDSCSLDVLGSDVWPEWYPRRGLRVDTYCGKMAIFGILFSLFCTFCSWSELFAIIKNFFPSFIQLFVWSGVLTKRGYVWTQLFLCLFDLGFDQSKLKNQATCGHTPWKNGNLWDSFLTILHFLL